ncbi:MAG: large subunit ribosomal protein L9 [Candidatus Azotimanducaceae bacterium]|jgi:large subunit ribosomal protein L9
MKVILLQDVAKIGRRFSVVDVPHGHALNMLIPKGMAQEATPQNLKNIQARTSKVEEDRQLSDASFSDALKALKETAVVVTVEANEKGHLFEALKSDKISDALHANGAAIKADQIQIETPIKELGEHTVSLVEGEVKGSVVITVVAA